MGVFKAPSWESQPCRTASIEIHAGEGQHDTVPIDGKPHYVLGKDRAACDVVLSDSSCSHQHAAVVHHQDGRLYLIDIASTNGTTLDGKKVAPQKPVQLHDGAALHFGKSSMKYVVRCEETGSHVSICHSWTDTYGRGSTGVKRRAEQYSGTVQASHLLVKHRDSRRPSSHKEKVVTRSKAEALQLIQGFREQIVSGQTDFATLAKAESHCSSATRGGDLGEFGPGQMQKSFEDATYALNVGELSEPVFSDSGVHLILRTA